MTIEFISDDGMAYFWDNNFDLEGWAATILQEAGQKVLTYAKQNAPWTDRTGNARAGLEVTVEADGKGEVVLELYHTVEYGLWLEVIQEGRFAIIEPTLDAYAPEVFTELANFIRNARTK